MNGWVFQGKFENKKALAIFSQGGLYSGRDICSATWAGLTTHIIQ